MENKYKKDKSPKKSPEAQRLCDETKRILETPRPSCIPTFVNGIKNDYTNKIIRRIEDKDLSNLEK